MPWWGWITVGALLLVAEITIVDLEFYLVFLGVSALAVGLSLVAGFAMPYFDTSGSTASMACASAWRPKCSPRFGFGCGSLNVSTAIVSPVQSTAKECVTRRSATLH